MALTINGTVITAIGFAFDGCHKIYLLENESDCEKMHDYGYDLYLIEGLPQAWADSCPLRFIESADLTTTYVGQGEPAFFKGWNIDEQLQADLDLMAQEQLEANKEVIVENKKYSITFTADEIRQVLDEEVSDEEVDEIAQCLIDLFNDYFYEWVRV